MDDNMRSRLLYEWNTRRTKLDFAIAQMERQLASVNKRLDSLKHDLTLYAGMLTIPVILYMLIALVTNILSPLSGFVFLVVFVIFRDVLLCVYIIFLPFNIYYLIRTMQTVKGNEEPSENIAEPPREGTSKDEPKPESTYRSEQQKLVFILSRYYLYQDALNQLKRELDTADCTMTLAELKQKLNQYPFYEEVRPAAPAKDMSARTQWFFILLVFSALISLVLLTWM
ncbi:MAG: hypothetical protein K2O32_04540 [Acetatifactor sp.]|nr:hypothetical protein [Acetatifactor sp.]